jgi:outer membrane receptor protein involved in Fe transport
LFNFRLGPTGDNWTAMVFVNNLLNKQTLLDTQPQINLQTEAFMRYIVNQPRTVGVDVTYKFH